MHACAPLQLFWACLRQSTTDFRRGVLLSGPVAERARTFSAPRSDCCGCNETALREALAPVSGGLPSGFPREHLLHAAFSTTIFEPAWQVSVDKSRNCVVVSCRGTLSPEDLITDGLAWPLAIDGSCSSSATNSGGGGGLSVSAGEPAENARILAASGLAPWAGGPPSTTLVPPQGAAYVHAGFWRSARHLRDELLRLGLLAGVDRSVSPYALPAGTASAAPAVGGAPRRTSLHSAGSSGDAPVPGGTAAACGTGGMQLVIVGHSLGAGVAPLLALQLRPYYPSLRCFALCPPSQLASASLAAAMRPFVVSVVNGKDLVPRLTFASVLRSNRAVAAVLASASVSKAALCASGLCGDEAAWPGARVCVRCCGVRPFSADALLDLAAVDRFESGQEELDPDSVPPFLQGSGELRASMRRLRRAHALSDAAHLSRSSGSSGGSSSSSSSGDDIAISIHEPAPDVDPAGVLDLQRLIADRRGLAAAPMQAPGRVLMLVKERTKERSLATLTCARLLSPFCGSESGETNSHRGSTDGEWALWWRGWAFAAASCFCVACVPCGGCLCRRRRSDYAPRWLAESPGPSGTGGLADLGRILVGHEMLVDHLPDVLAARLARVVRGNLSFD